MKRILPILIVLFSTQSFSIPVDWHGKLGVNSILHKSSSYLDISANTASQTNAGSQEIKLATNNNDELSVQTYLFTLSPDILVNDAVSIHTEFTSGYSRGGNLGSNTTGSQKSGWSNALYSYNFQGGFINQLNLEIFTDSATYLIGRYKDHFGLGAVVNDGSKNWDHFAYTRDGFMLKVQLGNFHINPFWSRLVSGKENADSSKIKEFGSTLIYDNMDKDITVGVLFSKKQASAGNKILSTTATGTSVFMDQTDTTLIDIFLKKQIGNLEIAVEAPFFSGEIGTITSTATKYDANAIIAQTNYKFGDSWKVGLDFGKVSGDAGSKTKFSAMYLNPNFQIANILFKYNRDSLANVSGSESLYSSYVNNVTYFKLKAELSNDEWRWYFNAIYAQAVEAASKTQTSAFNHSRNLYFTPTVDQDKNLGIEFDVNFNYQYNEELSFQGSFGYLSTGDYFAYNNTSTPNATKNAYAITVGTIVSF